MQRFTDLGGGSIFLPSARFYNRKSTDKLSSFGKNREKAAVEKSEDVGPEGMKGFCSPIVILKLTSNAQIIVKFLKSAIKKPVEQI